MGERVHVLVVPAAGATLTEAQIRQWAARHLERYKLADAVHFGTAIPRGRAGKADRSGFRRMLRSGEYVEHL